MDSPLAHTRILITCQAGLESLVKKDTQKYAHITAVQDRIIFAECHEESALYSLLMTSRYANRIYLDLASAKITDFNALFDLVHTINWRAHIPQDVAIVTEAMSVKSALSSTPTIQSITKKAILHSLSKGRDVIRRDERNLTKELHVQVFLIEDVAHIALDITGIALHKRGYRIASGDAPIKENLAAALVSIALWRFREPFFDIFCGSGTIAIEAAMLARNIAPGIDRHFTIEWHPFFTEEIFENAKKILEQAIYPSGNYTIIASDSDAGVLEKARENAERAGVLSDIIFEEHDILVDSEEILFGKYVHEKRTIISNPPFGERLLPDEIDTIYAKIQDFFRDQNVSGGIITNYPGWEESIDHDAWRNRKLYNGNIPAHFWIKR